MVMSRQDLISEMLSIQNTVNCNIDLNWKNKNREWYRASWIEAAEMADSLCYKWWKHQDKDLNNARIEASDILHFLLSSFIECNITADIIESHWKKSSQETILTLIDRLVFNLLKVQFEGASYIEVIECFSSICSKLNLSLEDLYICYISKATLNNFRQNNGYKTGTYIKQWGQCEDNVYLTEIIKDYLGGTEVPDNLQSVIYRKLQTIYDNIK